LPVAVGIALAVAGVVSGVGQPGTLERLVEAARLSEGARRTFCLGLRSSYSVAWHLHYTLSLAGKESIMLDAVGGIGMDPLGGATPEDVLITVSVMPYTRQTIEITEHARREAGLSVVAITD